MISKEQTEKKDVMEPSPTSYDAKLRDQMHNQFEAWN